MAYDFKAVESKWHQNWNDTKAYQVQEDKTKPKYYVLDMFPYPSGAGLHVGHPLGYIASDIYARYKRQKGFNVLHPMGFDAFGLPAEQYAIQTGRHPEDTTEENLATYKRQLNNIGLSFDWDRQVKTCDPKYYMWTQKIFLLFFNAWYDNTEDKAKHIDVLQTLFETEGNENVKASADYEGTFSADEWKSWSKKAQEDVLQKYRLAYIDFADVNWCDALGTVLANDEVKDGYSERGNHPVIKKKMRQWFLRITAYSQRLLDGLDTLEWTDSLKEIQRNWIGRSEGAEVDFAVKDAQRNLTVFTTRPDTIFGSTFMVLAPEHEWVEELTTSDKQLEVKQYVDYVQSRSERDRMSDIKTITGVFTGSYAINPFTGKEIPIWLSEYVLAGYGTGAIMAVPAHDARDYGFAKNFNLPIIPVIDGVDVSEEAVEAKSGKMINSGFLDGLKVKQAIKTAIYEVEKRGFGKKQINYKLRDAGFSRQRYWGEPFPISFKNDIPEGVYELPVTLPDVDDFSPMADGSSPLAKVDSWVNIDAGVRETNTMPGNAGSSWYFLRYMSPTFEGDFVDRAAEAYWQDVDLYVGGAEHATGHLLYARFWQKFLFDFGMVTKEEPFKKLINQGMIQGRSSMAYRIKGTNQFVSYGHKDDFDCNAIHVDVTIVNKDELDIEAFKAWRPDFADAEFILEDGKFICGYEVEKMSKSKFNVVNPDDMISKYGADVFRMYEMFLGPIEQHKPWDASGIDGVSRFVGKFWRLFHNEKIEEADEWIVTNDVATPEELKVLHTALKKVNADMEQLSYNTSISALMVAVNELGKLNCHKAEILNPMVQLLAPFAPFIAEELWSKLGNEGSVMDTQYPEHDEKHLVENEFEYPVSVNGKVRAKVKLPIDMGKDEVEKEVLALEVMKKWIGDDGPRKVIVVPKRIVNVVV